MKAELNDDKAKGVALNSGDSVAGPYRRLAAYLKPYKWRFIFGIIFGALYGVVNGGMVLVINYVTNIVFELITAVKTLINLQDRRLQTYELVKTKI